MNNPYDDDYDYESEVTETRDEMFWELQTTGSVFINNNKVTVQDLIEDLEVEELEEIVSMLFRRESTPLDDQALVARPHALESLFSVFEAAYDDEAILKHYIDDKTSY